MHKQESDERKGKGEGEPVNEAFDPHGRVSSSTNHAAYETHDEAGNNRANQQADSMQPRRMHERMWQEENAYKPNAQPEESELQNSERWIGSAERDAEERYEPKSASFRRGRNVFPLELRSGYCVNACFEDKLDEDFENEFEDEAQQIFHLAIFRRLSMLRRNQGIRSSSFAA